MWILFFFFKKKSKRFAYSPDCFRCSSCASGRSAHKQWPGLFSRFLVWPQPRHLTTVKRFFLFFPNQTKWENRNFSLKTTEQRFKIKVNNVTEMTIRLTPLSCCGSHTGDEQWAAFLTHSSLHWWVSAGKWVQMKESQFKILPGCCSPACRGVYACRHTRHF